MKLPNGKNISYYDMSDKSRIKRFKNMHCQIFRELLNKLNLVKNDKLNKLKIIIRIFKHFIKCIDDFHYCSKITEFEKFYITMELRLNYLITECDDIIKTMISEKNDNNLNIYQEYLEVLKKAKFEAHNNYLRSKMDLIREDICKKVFHPKNEGKLWSIDEDY